MSDAVITSEDGKSIILVCQDCGAESARIPTSPAPSGIFWCGICGNWAFDFDLVGLTEEEMWPESLDLVKLSGPLGPNGDDNPNAATVLAKVRPRWTPGDPEADIQP